MIDRFCYKRPRFGVPRLIQYVIGGTVLVYLLSIMDTDRILYDFLVFSPDHILRGQVWRLFTFIFVPIRDNPLWLLLTLYLSFMFGTSLEQIWGTARFNLYYFFNILFLAITGMIFHFVAPDWSHFIGSFVIGYYIYIFLIVAYTTVCPDLQFRLFFVFPLQSKWFGVIILGFFAYNLFQLRFLFPINLIPLVLFLPYLLFCGEALRRLLRLSKPASKTAVDFNRAAKRIAYERKAMPYTRKCEVCGKTDADYPDMEFRYCSRCNGYHCFCLDHINNHTHFLE